MAHDERARELDSDPDDLEERSEQLREEVDEVRGDWEAKKGDNSTPGAQPELDDGGHDESGGGDAQADDDES